MVVLDDLVKTAGELEGKLATSTEAVNNGRLAVEKLKDELEQDRQKLDQMKWIWLAERSWLRVKRARWVTVVRPLYLYTLNI
jgi:tRNA splicing endonuclease